MFTKQKTVSAAEFKAKCLALIDEVARESGEVIITKGGKPLAKLSPLNQPAEWQRLLGTVHYASEADILAPTGEDW